MVIEAGARLGPGCSVGHHAVIHAGVQLGAGCRVEDHAVLGRQPRPAPTSTVKVPKALPPLVVGDETSIGTGAVVYTGTTIGRQCLVGDLAFVREQVQIGDRVIVGTHVTVENAVSIGDNVKIQTGAYITAWTTIEADCFIAPCVVTTNDNYMGRTERRFAERGGAVIRRGARVGANVTLLAQRRGRRRGLRGRRLGGVAGPSRRRPWSWAARPSRAALCRRTSSSRRSSGSTLIDQQLPPDP